MSGSSWILVGAGGHASSVLDALLSQGQTPVAYVDPKPSVWLDAQGIVHISEQQLEERLSAETCYLAMGFLGMEPERLARRHALLMRYQGMGAWFPAVLHAQAIISPRAAIGAGAQVLAGAVVAGGADVGDGAVINSAAVVEHDAQIGAGAHVAPRAVVLGSARVGVHSFVGSGTVIVQGAALPPSSFVKALQLVK